jgi:hypothetical protein
MLEMSKLPTLSLQYKAITIKTAWYWHTHTKKRDTRTNMLEDLDINPHCYSQLIFDKGAHSARWRKDSLFNKCCWEN